MKRKLRIVYGVFSYVACLSLILMPALVDFNNSFAAVIFCMTAGGCGIVLTMITNTETGLRKSLGFRYQLNWMIFISVLTGIAPYVLGFYPGVGLIFLLLASVQVLLGAYTYKVHFMGRKRDPQLWYREKILLRS